VTGWRRAATLVALVVVLAALAGCTRREVGRVVVVDDGARVEQVLRARAALAEPVPVVVARSGALRDDVEEVWTAAGDSAHRAALVDGVDTTALVGAADGLARVELLGDGPDVEAARAAAADATGPELADLPALVAPDEQLLALVAEWDESGSYSQQIARFGALEQEARALAASLDRPAAVPCTAVWARRVEAAERVADRTAELLALVERRDGEGFDRARDAWADDPLGTGGVSLGELDAEAARACWATDSTVAATHRRLLDGVGALEAALDPEDLRAP
jgi:hypothetical protein